MTGSIEVDARGAPFSPYAFFAAISFSGPAFYAARHAPGPNPGIKDISRTTAEFRFNRRGHRLIIGGRAQHARRMRLPQKTQTTQKKRWIIGADG